MQSSLEVVKNWCPVDRSADAKIEYCSTTMVLLIVWYSITIILYLLNSHKKFFFFFFWSAELEGVDYSMIVYDESLQFSQMYGVVVVASDWAAAQDKQSRSAS